MATRAAAYASHAHPVLQPRASGRYKFALTPLADAMFQLLIFFMLTSSLTPYSLLTIRSGAEPGDVAADPNAAPTPDPVTIGENARIWEVESGQIMINDAPYLPATYAALAAAVSADPSAEVILVMRSSAQVQDLTQVLEALTSADVTAVKIAQTRRAP